MSPAAETIGWRIKAVRGGLSQDAFGEQLGVAKDTVGKYERNRIVPGGDVLARIHVDFGVDINWLLTGEGQMRPGGAGAAPSSASAAIDADMVGRVLEEISLIYKEFGWGKSLSQLGSEAAQIAADLAADGQTPEEKGAAVKAAGAMLRRQLRAAVADPNSDAARARKA
ncbi:MAG: helix-turn-helix transcriptional regulator [Phaeospirillum sp.]|nr:helix-turn-helix transcriptional regulator [Phaeospirillum sp.]